MVLLTNQFHDSFERLSLIGHKKYICAQSETIIFLCDGVQLQTRLFACTCLAPVGELFSRRVFSFQWKMHQLKKSDCGLIEGKFVNIATCCLSVEFLGFLGSIFTENSSWSQFSYTSRTANSRVCMWTLLYKKIAKPARQILASDWAQTHFLCPIRDKHSNESWNWFAKKAKSMDNIHGTS